MIVDTGYETVAMCGGHFFDCSDGIHQSGRNVLVTSEGELLRASVRRDCADRIRRMCGAQHSLKVSCMHVHLSSHYQGRIIEDDEMEEILDDG